MRNVAVSVGFLAVVLALGVPLLFGSLRPAYSHTRQFISELGEIGAPNATAVNFAGFLPTGLAVWVFLVLVVRYLPQGSWTITALLGIAGAGLGYVVAAWLPCDPGCPATGPLRQQVHSNSGLVEYVGSSFGFVIMAMKFRRSEAWHPLWLFSLFASVATIAGLALMMIPSMASSRGLAQRLSEAAIFAWIGIVAGRLSLMRGTRQGPTGTETS